MRLTGAQHDLLVAMQEGATLKSHRDLDGQKAHLLHPLQGPPQPVAAALVESLRQRDLIQSNLKFPAATYVLTDKAVESLSS